jgi:hypothetical protein
LGDGPVHHVGGGGVKTKFIEVNNGFNWGKFLVMRFDQEWQVRSALPSPYDGPLLRQLGWAPEFVWVLDLQTGEGAFYRPNG